MELMYIKDLLGWMQDGLRDSVAHGDVGGHEARIEFSTQVAGRKSGASVYRWCFSQHRNDGE